MIISGDRLFALVSQHQLPADDPNIITFGTSVQVRAFNLHPDVSPSPDNTWGTSGTNGRTYSYNHCGLVDPGDPPPSQPCDLRGTQLLKAPDGALYVAGSQTNHIDRSAFLLKLNANGSVVTSHGNQGWVIQGMPNVSEEPGGLVTRVTGLIVLPGPTFKYTYDVFMVSAQQRTCGEGIVIYNFSSAGDFVDRSWTNGGSGVGGDPLCRSIRAKDMVMIPDGPLGTGGGHLAIVGQYLTKPAVTNAPQGHAAMLLTWDPNNLKNSQTVQEILAGGDVPYEPRYGFRAARYNSQTKRLMAVGEYSQDYQYDTDYSGLVARLKQAPLFADGFED